MESIPGRGPCGRIQQDTYLEWSFPAQTERTELRPPPASRSSSPGVGCGVKVPAPPVLLVFWAGGGGMLPGTWKGQKEGSVPSMPLRERLSSYAFREESRYSVRLAP